MSDKIRYDKIMYRRLRSAFTSCACPNLFCCRTVSESVQRAALWRTLPHAHAPHSLATLSAGLLTMLEQMKAKAKEGAHKAEVAAKSTKLKADIMLLENKKNISNSKQLPAKND